MNRGSKECFYLVRSNGVPVAPYNCFSSWQEANDRRQHLTHMGLKELLYINRGLEYPATQPKEDTMSCCNGSKKAELTIVDYTKPIEKYVDGKWRSAECLLISGSDAWVKAQSGKSAHLYDQHGKRSDVVSTIVFIRNKQKEVVHYLSFYPEQSNGKAAVNYWHENGKMPSSGNGYRQDYKLTFSPDGKVLKVENIT